MTGGDVIFNFKGNTNDIEKDTNGLASKIKGIALPMEAIKEYLEEDLDDEEIKLDKNIN